MHERRRTSSGKRPMASETKLVERCLTGDVRAFEKLVARHYGQVYAYASRMVGAEQAEDVAQDVFLRTYRALPSYRGDAAFVTWLYRITHNTCVDYLRRRQRERMRSLSLYTPAEADGAPPLEWLPAEDEGVSDPHKRAEERELQEKLHEALMRLSDKHRAVLVLHDMHGFRYDEIKDIIGCSLGTVRSRLHYARRALKKVLREMYPDQFDLLLADEAKRAGAAGGAPSV